MPWTRFRTFCDTSTFGARMHFYSPAKVFAMMEHLHRRFGVRHERI